jgi:cytochrome P450
MTMSEATAPGASQDFYFNPWDENFRANPYPHYKPLLAGPPRIIDLFGPTGMVTRYVDVMAVLRDHAHFSSERQRDPSELPNEGPFAGARTMLFSDPPTHTRLRRLVSRDFTPRRIRELEPRIREIAKNLIDPAQRKGELEVMSGFADALPVMVIAEMLGVPPDHYEQFKHWSDTVVSGDNTLPGTPLPEQFHSAIKALRGYFAEEIERRRKNPGADLISALVAAHDDAEAMNADELLAFVLLLLLAGNETTTNLIGNGMLALGRNPAQMNLLRQRPELIAGSDRLNPDDRSPRAAGQSRMLHNTCRGKSRSGAVRRSRSFRHHPRASRPRRVRRGNPLLHRRATGADGGCDRDRRDARALPAAAAEGSRDETGLQGIVLFARSRVAAAW